VGDSPVEDVQGARAAGLRAILVARDGAPPPAGVPVIRSLQELLTRRTYPW
jgi:FMN phosphatase YigB (HAD superfamily)